MLLVLGKRKKKEQEDDFVIHNLNMQKQKANT